MKLLFLRLQAWLQGLSFCTGAIILLMAIPFYILSFAQTLIPSEYLSVKDKGILFTVFFGLAKTCQYGGLTILGTEGYKKVKSWLTH